MAREYTRRDPTIREATRKDPTTREATGKDPSSRKIDNTKSVEERNREARDRSRERRLQESFAEARLGGMGLSERLRQKDAQQSTRVRRRIKQLFKDEDARRTYSGVDQNAFDAGIDSTGRANLDFRLGF